ncbi:DUF5808 domain-containing protein [Paenibacillus faecis]|uniref:DUF5808 domain-containing protein n=1 Tax=Paenibacillus faecis TaxID=862114 RepID=UPI002010F09A|nr:DUF5808 domain-containing protein [Paenibacillus faecis]
MIPIFTLLLSGIALFSYIVLLATYGPQTKYQKGMLFAVTLPGHAMEHPETARIQAGFRRRFRNVSLGMALLFVPVLFLRHHMAFQAVYFFMWFPTFFIVMALPFRKAFRQTLALKREHDWFVGPRRVVMGDLRVARLKNRKSAPLWLFSFPFAMAGGTLLWTAREEKGLLAIAVGGLAVTALLFLISALMRRSKAKVYSENSEVNLSLNQARRRVLSFLWLAVAVVENIHFYLITLSALRENDGMTGFWTAVTLLFTAIPLAMVIYAYRKIRVLENDILAQEGKEIVTDDDEYWANGFTYHNPDDRSVFVPKRVGMGETVNTATLTGKILVWGVLGLTASVLVGVIFMLIRSELTSPELRFAADNRVEIDYPMYSYGFRAEDIRDIALVDELPTGIKINGEATDRHARGHFRLKELGKARLYVFKDRPPFIRIKLKDGYIFYNEEEPGRTQSLYDQLKERVASGMEN